MTRRRTADERRAAEYYRKVATEASAAAADYLAKAVRTQLPRTRRWLLEGARRSTRKAIEFRTLAAGLDLPPGQLEPPPSYR